ncbi:MAG: class I SAM-dependent rRNA methyltransferase [Anaerolineaceae bacterium]|nr:class I SAM-dependent rRNA methyltransferase [Anaerolineaceae bacterium]
MTINPALFTRLPAPAARNVAIRVTPAAERALRKGHPWCYESAITHQSRDGAPGDLAVIFDHNRKFLAVGLYDPTSMIRVRVLQHKKSAQINTDWFARQLEKAIKLRAPLANLPEERRTNGYRLVHGENDGLPGLIIDRYADTLVIKLYTPAWIPYLKSVCTALAQLHPAERLILRLNRAMQDQPSLLYGLSDGIMLSGPVLDGPILFQENGLIFEADPVHGQKTGFFLDQRHNRARVETLSAGKSILNVFAYTGGFSVYAARGGATHVISLDQSAPACEAAKRNMLHNQHYPAVAAAVHKTIAADAFEVMASMAKNGQQFDLVIIDPPMFAQKRSQIAAAVSAYRRLTQMGLNVLQPGGILVQASCSSRVDAETFFNTIHRTAREMGRPLQEMERTTHAPDHPITFPEGAYLKCLFAKVT